MGEEQPHHEHIQAVVFSSSFATMARPKQEYMLSYGNIGELTTKLGILMKTSKEDYDSFISSSEEGSINRYHNKNNMQRHQNDDYDTTNSEGRDDYDSDDDDDSCCDECTRNNILEPQRQSDDNNNSSSNKKKKPKKAKTHCIVDLDDAYELYWSSKNQQQQRKSFRDIATYTAELSEDLYSISSIAESSWQFRAALEEEDDHHRHKKENQENVLSYNKNDKNRKNKNSRRRRFFI